jgi:hypothetical protein
MRFHYNGVSEIGVRMDFCIWDTKGLGYCGQWSLRLSMYNDSNHLAPSALYFIKLTVL